jgi:predicted negative regulator of RcsB-dependent stress response
MARSFRKEIKAPDSFQLTVQKTLAWYRANEKTILVAAGALVIAIGSYVGYWAWNTSLHERAALGLAIAESLPSEPAVQQATLKALRKVSVDFPGTKAGILAKLRLGALLIEGGEHKAAEREYRGGIKTGGLGEMESELARRGLAGSLSLQGKCTEALPIWGEILTAGSLLAQEDLYISQSACLAELGKKGAALKSLETLIEKHPGSPFITPELRARMDHLRNG